MIINSTIVFCLVAELKDALVGLRISEVSISPDHRELLFSLRGKGRKATLFFSAHSDNCRIEIWDEDESKGHGKDYQKTNLLWYAAGGYVQNVKQQDFDRVVRISCGKKTQFGPGEGFDLLFELTGRNSNAILVKKDGTIVDCLRKIDAARSRFRQILPGERYLPPPPSKKRNPFTVTKEELSRSVGASDKTIIQWLLAAFVGTDELLAQKILRQAQVGTERKGVQLTQDEIERLWGAFHLTFDQLSTNNFSFGMVMGEDGAPEALTPVDLPFVPSDQRISYQNLNSAIKSFFSLKMQIENRRKVTRELSAILRRALKKLKDKAKKIEDDLRQAERFEEYRRFGDLLMMNKENIKKGNSSAELEDMFDPELPTVVIPLDPKLTAIGNAQRYFKRHKKAKDALTRIEKRRSETAHTIDQLEKISRQLEKPGEDSNLEEIRQNMIWMGLVREPKPTARAKKEKKTPFRTFLTEKGGEILVGRNNKENDYLTFRFARPDDLWFHAEGVAGSHVLLRRKDRKTEPSSSDIREAAKVAAHFSKARNENKAEVIYTQAKYVRKPKRAKPGLASVEREKSIVVKPGLPNTGGSSGKL